jgi:hypothetical protein
MQGEAADQVSVKQPSEPERPTRSLLSNSTRRRLRSIVLFHVSHDRTCRHQTTFGPWVRHTKGAPRGPCQRDGTPSCTIFVYLVCLVGPVNLGHGGLSTRVSTVTRISGRTGYYTIPVYVYARWRGT